MQNVQSLLVDDDKIAIFLHDVIIRESGFSEKIKACTDAGQALAFLESMDDNAPPCFIFLDINMPDMSGWEFIDRIAMLNIKIPIYVVMVTSSIDEGDKKKAAKYKQIIFFAEKPLSEKTCEQIKSLDSLAHLFKQAP